jgi:phospholipid-binding lipoprotein MlaA
LFGPSNFRDGIGLGVDMAMSPWSYIVYTDGVTAGDTYNIASFTADGLVRREQNIEGIDALREGSLDFYAQMRSVYRQYRAKQIGGSSTSDMPKFDDYN